jgi:PAS domain-containing protein
MLLRLDRPGGWLLGAAYRTDALRQLFVDANLDAQGMTALIDTRLGRVQSVAGPAATDPNYDIARSPMYAAIQRVKDDTWIGPSAPDGVRRIHGFHAVPGHQLTTVVAVNETDAMQPANGWTRDLRLLALAATVVVLAGAGIALYAVLTFRSKRRLRQSLERERMLVANAQAELVEARARLGGRFGQLQALFAAIAEGTLVLDAELRVSEWNEHFPGLFGVAPQVLQFGLPLDELLRIQAREGAFGPLQDVEAEVARRVVQLRTGSENRPTIYPAADERALAVFTSRHADGSLLLVVREAAQRDLNGASADQRALAPSPTETF